MTTQELNLDDFWEDSDYARKEYVGAAFSAEDVRSIEEELGYKLPDSYITFMQFQNGGIPKRTNHRTSTPSSWSHDHIAITGIFSLDRSKEYSLCGTMGSKFWMEEWEYPPIGIYFADCPSSGHDMMCLDYRQCGPQGEPQVVHVDQECDYKITFVAENFAAFIRGLEDDDAFEEV